MPDDSVRISAVRCVEFCSNRKALGAEDLFEPGTRDQSRHPTGDFRALPVKWLIQAEVPSSRRSRGGSIVRISAPELDDRLDRSQARTQTHDISGMISQCPSGRTPPHGPLRRFFGQVIGQVMPVLCSTHWPHILQSKTGVLLARSPLMNARSTQPPGNSQRRKRPSKRSLAA